MASRRRSLEEKNLKILRELAAYPANKQCFDCHQRGPTYINMTIGSFVCTSCSGLLRGLTPPHRVKSITMTMFTPEEIEFLKSRGNEYCKHVWLGTYDSRTSNMENDGKDDHRKRDLMVQKYEKKRWYVDPEIAMKKMQHDQQLQQKQATHTPLTSNTKQYGRVPEVQPLSQLLGKSPTALVVDSSQVSDKWPHPVSSASAPHVTTASQSQGTANGNFANFETAFNSFHTPAPKDNALNLPPPPPPPTSAITTAESEKAAQDRYAALADLDSCFHQPAAVTSPGWTVKSVAATTNTTSAASIFSFSSMDTPASSLFTTAASNPFVTPAPVPWSQAIPRPIASANPFQSMTEPSLPYQQLQLKSNFAPLPVVGNSPSDDTIRAQYSATNSAPFPAFSSGDVTSPPNGFGGGQFFVQNGDFTNSGSSPWGMSPSTSMPPTSFSTSQLLPSGNEKRTSEILQYSNWPQNPANPFMAGPGNVQIPSASKNNSNNPFL